MGKSSLANRLIPGTTPTVDIVMCLAPIPMSELMRVTAFQTDSKFASGSPIPMKTMLSIRLSPAR